MAPPSDRSGVGAAVILWLLALAAVAMLGLEVTEESPRRWIGHWIANVWAFAGWLPLLILARGRRARAPGGRG